VRVGVFLLAAKFPGPSDEQVLAPWLRDLLRRLLLAVET